MIEFATFSITLPYPSGVGWLIYLTIGLFTLLWHSVLFLLNNDHQTVRQYWVEGKNYVTLVGFTLVLLVWPMVWLFAWKNRGSFA